MDNNEIVEWLDDEDKMLAAVQVTITMLLNQRNQNPKCGGSTIGQQEIWRNRLQGHKQLYHDYFSDTPNYPEEYFR
jgi:hypothetical protein